MQLVWYVVVRWCADWKVSSHAQSARIGVAWIWAALAFQAVCTAAEVEVPVTSRDHPIVVQADQYTQWQEGQYDVLLLHGNCRILQGAAQARARDAVLWISRGDPRQGIPSKITAYLETDVFLNFSQAGEAMPHRQWLGRFHTDAQVHLEMPPQMMRLSAPPPVVRRGIAARQWEADTAVRQAQFTAPPVPLPPAAGLASGEPNARLLTTTPRSGGRYNIEVIPSPNPNESITAITMGVRFTIEGVNNVAGIDSGTVTIEADRVIIWTDALSDTGSSVPVAGQQQVEGQWEFYLEGHVVFREGDRVIYADRMYYDVTRRQGMILNAESLTPIPNYEGLMRLKADVLQQLDRNNFMAYDAAITSSRMGVPRYWLQAGNVALQDTQRPTADPFTGQPAPGSVDHELLATSVNNFLYVGGVPVLYWPVLATDLLKPTYYVNGVRLGSDSVLGTQAMVDWDVYQLLGLSKDLLPGSDWSVSTDWLSERGFALGTNFRYASDGLFRLPGPSSGEIDAWGLKDSGNDNLGFDRRSVVPEEEFRGRVRWQHRQMLPGGYQLTGEFGVISDRNFLEQYFESEWDQFKDQTTSVELKRYAGNSSWSVMGQARLNDFFTQTEWLPRLDHYLLGQSLLGDRLTWHAHSHVGYANLRAASPPSLLPPAQAKFDPLAWEQNREGIHTATRHEIDLPLNVGPAKVVPFVGGELFHIGEDLTGQQATRALGQAGARTSVSWWRADPAVYNTLLNVNGLAHKVELKGEFLWADAEEDLARFPLYEELDDDSVEFFRRRFFFDTFGGTPGGDVPLRFDERFFALRSGMQRHVTAPSTAIADDLMLLKMGLRQRWQTKRGPPGHERIIDWIVVDVEGSYFPRPSRDNFGQEFGLIDFDFRWHVGDRVTLLSDGFADFFGDGLRTLSVGGVITRPERGNAFLGFRSIEGPISSSILTSSISYRMSEKWIFTGGTSVDFGAAGNIGQFVGLTRIGESALLRIGFTADRSRGNVGVNFAIEPRFLLSNRLGYVGGVQIPPAGARGLE